MLTTDQNMLYFFVLCLINDVVNHIIYKQMDVFFVLTYNACLIKQCCRGYNRIAFLQFAIVPKYSEYIKKYVLHYIQHNYNYHKISNTSTIPC